MGQGKRDSEDLKSRVEKWLNRQGFPFELEVGRQLLQAGLHDIEHGHFYRDLGTSKWREVDILATRFVAPKTQADRAEPPVLKLRLVVECKHASKPWVVLASQSSPAERQFPSGYLLGRVTRALVESAELLDGTGVSLRAFGVEEIRGHGVVEAALGTQPSRKRAAYSAIRAVVSAAAAESVQIDETSVEIERPPNPPLNILFLVLPIIVLRGTLFRLSIDDKGETKIAEVDDAAVLAPVPNSGLSSTLVRIVKPGAPLSRVVAAAIDDAEHLSTLLRPAWNKHIARATRLYGLNLMTRESSVAELMYDKIVGMAAGERED